MTRDFNKQSRDDARPPFRNKSSNKFGEERSSRPARPRLNRETVDRAWESGAQTQHHDYRPRTSNGQPPRNNQRTNRPSEYSPNGNRPYDTRSYRGPSEGGRSSYGNRSESRPYEGGRPYRNRPDEGRPSYGNRSEGRSYEERRPYDNRSSSYGNRAEGGNRPYNNRYEGGRSYGRRYEDERPSYGSRYEGGRPEGGRSYDNRSSSYGNRAEGGNRPYNNRYEGGRSYGNQRDSRPDSQPREKRSSFRGGERDTFSRFGSERDQEREVRREEPRSFREGRRETFHEEPRQSAPRGRYEGDYEGLDETPRQTPYFRNGKSRHADEEQPQEHHVTRMADGRVLKGPRPVQRKNAQFWQDITDDTEDLIGHVHVQHNQDEPETGEPLLTPLEQPADEAPELHTVTARHHHPDEEEETDALDEAVTTTPQPARKRAATSREKKSTAEKKPGTSVLKPSQRGFKWPTP